MDLKKIGSFLKLLRKQKGLVQEELAEYLNVSVRTVSRWETGSNMPDLDILIILSDYYNVDIREILNGERKNIDMGNEKNETIIKIADYSAAREKLLLQKILCIVVTGCIAWGISLITALKFMNNVIGTSNMIIDSLVCLLLYSIAIISFKCNRTASGFLNALIAGFISITVSNLLVLLLFFAGGSYQNYGIAGLYYSILIFAVVFAFSSIFVTVFNKKNSDK